MKNTKLMTMGLGALMTLSLLTACSPENEVITSEENTLDYVVSIVEDTTMEMSSLYSSEAEVDSSETASTETENTDNKSNEKVSDLIEAMRKDEERFASEAEEAERKATEEAEKKAQEEAEQKAKEEEEARQEAERKAAEEAERKAKEEAEKKAKEEAERKAKEEAERKAQEEATRKAAEEAARAAEKKVSLVNLNENKSLEDVPEEYAENAKIIMDAILGKSDKIDEFGQITFTAPSSVGWDELKKSLVLEYILPVGYSRVNIGWSDICHVEEGQSRLEVSRTWYEIAATLNVSELRTIYNQEKELETYIKNAASVVKAGMTEKEAYKAVHDYVCDYLDYDHTLKIHDVLTAFKEKLGVCEAYARMTKAICDYVGIECEYVTGPAFGGVSWGYHAWNRVKLNGTWYYSDPTWDGQDTITKYNYYLSETLWSNHKLDS